MGKAGKLDMKLPTSHEKRNNWSRDTPRKLMGVEFGNYQTFLRFEL